MENKRASTQAEVVLVNPCLKLFIFEKTDSTNRLAKDFARGMPLDELPTGECYCPDMNYLFIANEQSKGKGRLGRRFESDAGVGLYMSYLFSPNLPPERITNLTAYAAVCSAEAIENLCGGEVGIKWVNDLYIGGKKAAGILTEASLSPEGGISYAAVGIGINIKSRDFGELAHIATTLEDGLGATPDPKELALSISKSLAEYEKAEASDFMKKYRAKNIVIGKTVRVTPIRGESYISHAVDIADSGELVLEDEHGCRHTISAADVSVKLSQI